MFVGPRHNEEPDWWRLQCADDQRWRALVTAMSFLFLIRSAAVCDAGQKGRGVFAREAIPAGCIVAGWGGMVCAEANFAGRPGDWEHALQIAKGLFPLPPPDLEDANLVNRSCDPNFGMEGNVVFVAMRDIAAGEELCFDYTMTDANEFYGFERSCGTAKCRGVVSGADWTQSRVVGTL